MFTHRRPRRLRPRGRPPYGPRRRAHPGLRAAGLHRHGEDARSRARWPSSATAWCSATPSTCSSSPGTSDRRARGPARVHGLGRRDHHRLRRLPGVLDGPRLRGRGDQAPPRRAQLTGCSRSRRRVCASAPTWTATSASWAPRPRWRSRPRSAPTSRSPSTSARRSTWSATTRRARWSAPTAGSTAASPGTASTRRRTRCSSGSSRAASTRTSARESTAYVAQRRTWTASPSAARSASRRSRCARWWSGRCAARRASAPRHLLGIGDVDDILHAVGAGIDIFDCATPTRLARHGTALVPDPERRWRLDLSKAPHR